MPALARPGPESSGAPSSAPRGRNARRNHGVTSSSIRDVPTKCVRTLTCRNESRTREAETTVPPLNAAWKCGMIEQLGAARP